MEHRAGLVSTIHHKRQGEREACDAQFPPDLLWGPPKHLLCQARVRCRHVGVKGESAQAEQPVEALNWTPLKEARTQVVLGATGRNKTSFWRKRCTRVSQTFPSPAEGLAQQIWWSGQPLLVHTRGQHQ